MKDSLKDLKITLRTEDNQVFSKDFPFDECLFFPDDELGQTIDMKSYEIASLLYKREIKEDHLILFNICGEPGCCNPNHYEEVSQAKHDYLMAQKQSD